MKEKFYTVFLAFLLLFVTFSMIIFPEASLHASIKGLDTWWRIVFPSLLPFFIAAELLIRFGVVNFIGVLFEPIMRPLFNVPGIGSFAWMVGMASGYPSGAKISAMLREKEQVSQIEAERLVAFTNAASPLFIFGAIAVGLFHHPELGILIAVSHYIGNILVGFLMRFYKREPSIRQTNVKKTKDQHPIVFRAFQKMHRTRLAKKQPIGEILGQSVTTSVQTLLMIGGFIILFSVLTTILQVTHLTEVLQVMLTPVFLAFHLPSELIPGMFTGLFEITLGSDLISNVKQSSLTIQMVAVSFLLGFNGFSVHAQVASILSKTDIRYTAYFYGRLLHAVFSGVISWIIFTIYVRNNELSMDSFPAFLEQTEMELQWINDMYNIGPVFTITSIALAFLFMLHKWAQQRRPLS